MEPKRAMERASGQERFAVNGEWPVYSKTGHLLYQKDRCGAVSGYLLYLVTHK